MASHTCYACRDHDDRISFDDGRMLRVPARFRGPPGNVNGGMAAGMLACSVLHAAARNGIEHVAVSRITARLRAGVPVERDLAVDVTQSGDQYAITLRDGGADLITATAEFARFDAPPRPGDAIGDPSPERAADIAWLAALPVPDRPPWYEDTGEHPIPGCFSCGQENSAGLHVYPRVVEDGVTCATWQNAMEFDNGDGTLSTAVLTSAIDCSSGICTPVQVQRDLLVDDQFFLLGTMDVRYLRVSPLGDAYQVTAKALGRDGRKLYGLSVLASGDAVAYATAESTWIIAAVPRSEALGA